LVRQTWIPPTRGPDQVSEVGEARSAPGRLPVDRDGPLLAQDGVIGSAKNWLVVHSHTETLEIRQRFGVALPRLLGQAPDSLLEPAVLVHDNPPMTPPVPQRRGVERWPVTLTTERANPRANGTPTGADAPQLGGRSPP